ncbi:TPA: acetyl-CoA carboxylase biotin carboxyl carrier protein subunit [Burkholderia cenocepacia]|uniref:Acetyl-CoA carboxylase biotin carboxyl carrier protein subunit n=1 Tax=Burkholderia latens TaxID=488446 RepID=A0A6H9SUT9_9BURK|nr:MULTISPECIES: acetyl-CoA carboxylase biotin carboxyl carrier protein subunit [Burkholderia]KAB0644491.1 acetyl-CoA carboxylase biotin carboxyl carrier protein subunit [Burkholderia latens]MBJ9924392.1 acetyl-CoA carboxylase biotin carboxyl carrier protein subunit [Burkholderia cenocepacia]UJH78794.1 acetyl-CoA carboxylase biotin carboxyl carrier protein subunit [Burkholderia cenocepacia]VWB23497.1 hypothetical protein BLA24064_00945 [Burkholderia latens]HDR9882387.1 acetyl-CoA carboxylase b
MMDLQRIERLIATLQHAGVAECVYTIGNQTIRLEFDCHTSPIANEDRGSWGTHMSGDGDPSFSYVRAPCSGHFARVHPFRDQPVAGADTVVNEGQHIAYIEVDSMLFPVVAPFRGRLGKIAVADGDRVGFGAALIEIERIAVK